MIVEIPLTKGYTAIIDSVDADLANVSWHPTNGKHIYAVSGTYKIMHRVIMERVIGRKLAKGERVDHINNRTLDNRRENLRIATAAQNTQNTLKSSNSRNIYKGAVHTSTYRWSAYIKPPGQKAEHLGNFDTELEAHRVWCIAALKYFGEYANFGGNSPFTKEELQGLEIPPKQSSRKRGKKATSWKREIALINGDPHGML